MKLIKQFRTFLINHKETFINLLILFVQEIAKMNDKDLSLKE